MAEETQTEVAWGRVLLAGGTDWATNGRRDRSTTVTSADLLSPRILRSLCNVKVTTLISGPAANYFLVIDIHGSAYLFGKSPSSMHPGSSAGVISQHKPKRITPRSLGLEKGTKFIGGAAARAHAFLVDSLGGVWGCENNSTAQLGLVPSLEVGSWTRINGPWTKEGEKIVQVSVGHTFSLFLSDAGKVYSTGSSENGQLGNGKTVKAGKTGYDLEYPPRRVQGLDEKKIVQIASGNQHSLALDEDGYLYAWGYAGYSRLGLQDQKDRLVPTIVPSFTGTNPASRVRDITCGPTSSVVIDRSGIFYIAGKFKTTGEGSTGSPYTSFKAIQDLMGCRVIKTSCGGCTHFITTPNSTGGIMTAGFGQGVLYGELGLGEEIKGASKPEEIAPLEGIDIIDIGAGAFTTLFLARPNAQMSEILRYPEHVASATKCLVCKIDRGDEGAMECEKCDQPYHPDCLTPPLTEPPEGEWFCPVCEKEEAEGPSEDEAEEMPPPATKGNARSRASVTPASVASRGKGRISATPDVAGKRKASETPSRTSTGSAKKRK